MMSNSLTTRIGCRLCLGIVAAVAGRSTARAGIVGPYLPNANTVHLYHFDEAAGATATANAGTVGNSAVAWNGSAGAPATPNTLLGAAGFVGFGNFGDLSATPNAFAFDGNNNGAYDPDVNSSTLSPDGVTSASITSGAGSFTLEALVRFGDGTTATTYREFMSTDSSNTGGNRGFSFRITAAGDLQFRDGDSEDTRVYAAVPTTGAHAYDTTSWFHIAYAYDANDVMGPGTGTGSLFWTKLDDSISAANLLTQQTTSTNSGNPIIPINFADGPLILGGEGRTSNGGTLQGFIDEARISNVALGARDFMFVPEPTSGILLLLGISAAAVVRLRRR